MVEALAEKARLHVEAFERMDVGQSGDVVLRLAGPTPAFAKVSSGSRISRRELAREVDALSWLGGRFGAPELIWRGELLGRPVMISEVIEGQPLHELSDPLAGAVATIRTLRQLHHLSACPFDARLAVTLPEAAQRVRLGEVDEADFDSDNLGRSAEVLFEDLAGRAPRTEDVVVCHGDACCPNFILRPDGLAGIIDLGRFGLADRHHDLALFLRSAAFNFPDLDVRALLAEHYDLAPLDDDKLEFYRQLDEFY